MPELLTYEEIWSGFLAIDEILLYLHYSIRLEIEHDGQADDVKIEILRGPQQEFESEITEHLAKHSEDYVLKRLKCPRCGELLWEPNLTACPRQVYRTELQPPRNEQCRAPLELVRHEFGDEFVREKAALALMGRGSFVGRKCLVGKRIAMRVLGKLWTPYDVDMHVCLGDLRDRVRAEMTDQVDGLNTRVSLRDPARLLGRRDLYPRGETLAARHSDYLETRDKLISCYHWLDGRTANHPTFIERDEQARGIRLSLPPVQLPANNNRVPDVPVWDSDRRELRFRGQVCKSYPKSPADNQTTILQSFQEAGWPSAIDDPLSPVPNTPSKQRLRETVRGLKNGLKHLTFRPNGNGTGIIWEAATPIRPPIQP